ncbi:hypothetical protein HCH_03468 [Hahella chejuensis KCTC 2396]|uniref:Uncharacterized protein n=1 Tax=Hahella chejuensis (strain KCTC 2396) TaxID=349521 RepID=Q2SGK9_HAHCH|nr:hypothetical protein HCH_03468 [Hahella chejuensis KCTC 2396]
MNLPLVHYRQAALRIHHLLRLYNKIHKHRVGFRMLQLLVSYLFPPQ